MLSKRLICLSLIVTTLFIPNHSNAMATTAVVGAAAAAMAAPAATTAGATGAAVIAGTATHAGLSTLALAGAKVVLTGATAIAATGAVGTVAVVGGSVIVVGGASVGAWHGCKWIYNTGCPRLKGWWYAPSPATIDAALAKDAANASSDQATKRFDNLTDFVIFFLKTKLGQDEKTTQSKTHEFLQKLKEIIKQGGKDMYKLTLKDHPCITLAVVAITSGACIYVKYGEQIERFICSNLPDSWRPKKSTTDTNM